MSESAGGESAPWDEVGDASTVLLLVPALDGRDDEACARLLTPVPPREARLLSVTFTGSPDERMDAWRSHVDGDPKEVVVVDVGGVTRSTSAAAGGAGPVPGSPVSIETVSSPGDLTDIGIRLTSALSEWAGGEETPVVCFHSLTALLQYVDVERAFRFVHVLANRLEESGAVAHFHMDPTAHDKRTRNTLKTLFDAVVEVDGDGWRVSAR